MLNLNDTQIQEMVAKNDEFRTLFNDHVQFEQDLEAISSLKFLPPEVETKMKEIKKIKLRGKDRMHQLVADAHSS